MIKSMTIRNYLGEEITVNLKEAEPVHGLLLSGADGIGPAEGIINISDYATIDGGLYNSSRMDKRTIELTFIFVGIPSIEETRHLTYKYFPVKQPVTLIFDTDQRLLSITGYVKGNKPTIFSQQEGCTVTIECDDPYFYEYGDSVPHIQLWSVLEPMFEFVYENSPAPQKNTVFSEYIIRDNKMIYYDGDGAAGFLIRINVLNAVGDITIEKTTTGEVFKIIASKIGAIIGDSEGIKQGDEIWISTYPKNRYIRLLRDGTFTSILNAIDRYSEWFLLDKGDNAFVYKAESVSGESSPEMNLMFVIETQNIYEGV